MSQNSNSNLNNVGPFSPPAQSPWIFDCGVTNTVTFDSLGLLSNIFTKRTHIQTANGECISVA